MPRLALSEREKQIDTICRRIRHHYDDSLHRGRTDCRTVAKAMGFPCYQTLVNRFRTPSDLTLGELMTIANTMNISLATLVSGKEDLYE